MSVPSVSGKTPALSVLSKTLASSVLSKTSAQVQINKSKDLFTEIFTSLGQTPCVERSYLYLGS